MSEIMEELWRMAAKENMVESAINFLKEGTVPLEVIARCIGLPLEEVKELKATIEQKPEQEEVTP